MFKQSTVDDLAQSAKSRILITDKPSVVEPSLLSALLNELESDEDSVTTFEAFYGEIVLPIEFTTLRSQVLWWVVKRVSKFNKEVRKQHILDYIENTPEWRRDNFSGQDTSKLCKDSKITKEEMARYVKEDVYAVKTTKKASEYLDLLKFAYTNQKCDQEIDNISARFKLHRNPKNAISELSRVIEDLRKLDKTNSAQSSKVLSELDVNHIAGLLHSANIENNFIPMADSEITKVTGGLAIGELNLFCAPPNNGKSLHLLRNAYHAFRQGKNSLYISLEMDERRVMQELVPIVTRQSKSDLLSITSQEEADSIAEMFNNTVSRDAKGGGKFIYSIALDISLADLLELVEVHVDLMGIDVVFIDLFNRIPIAGNPSSIHEAGGFYQRMLRDFIAIGKKYRCAIVGAVQLKTEAVQQGLKGQGYVGGSRYYEEEAGIIYRLDRPSETLNGEYFSEVSVIKHRISGKGFGKKWVFRLDPDTAKFELSQYGSVEHIEKLIKKANKEFEKRLDHEIEMSD